MRWTAACGLAGGVAFGLALAPAGADVVRFKGGGTLAGAVIDEDSDEQSVVVRTKHARQSIARSKIAEIERDGAPPPESYKSAQARHGQDADGRFKLGMWCEANGLPKPAPEHYRAALALDGQHAGARAKLGYKLVDGEWKTEAELMAAQGFVKDARGKWVLPQQKEDAELAAAKKKSRAENYRKVVAWQKQLGHPKAEKAAEARANFRTLTAADAVEPLLRYLGAPAAPAGHRQLCVETLAGIAGGDGDKALAKLAVEDEDEDVRGAAIKALVPRKSPALLALLAGQLSATDDVRADRAGLVLAEVGDVTVAPKLAAALTVQRKIVEEIPAENGFVGPNGTTGALRLETLPNGQHAIVPNVQQAQAGLAAGPQRRTRIVTVEREGVLAALQKISGEDFGFDQAKWLDWLRKRSQDQAGKLLKE